MGWGTLLGQMVSDVVQGYPSSAISRLRMQASVVAGEWVENRVTSGGADDPAWTVIRAMIAAAGADGEVDGAERDVIMGKARAAGLDDAQMARIEQELKAPASAETIAALAETAEHAEQIYRFAYAAVDVDSAAERQFFEKLAAGLKLSDAKLAEIQGERSGA